MKKYNDLNFWLQVQKQPMSTKDRIQENINFIRQDAAGFKRGAYACYWFSFAAFCLCAFVDTSFHALVCFLAGIGLSYFERSALKSADYFQGRLNNLLKNP